MELPETGGGLLDVVLVVTLPSLLNLVTVSETFVELLLPLTVRVTRRTIVFFVLVEVDEFVLSNAS